MDSFRKTFLQSLVTEAGADINDDIALSGDADSEKASFDAALNKGTPPDAFDTDPLGGSEGGGGQSDYIDTAKHWIHKLDQFAEELNGLDPNSLNSQLNEIDKEGSIFRGIVNDQSDDIVKVTEILKAMGEGIKGYIIGAKRKQREQNSQNNV